MVGETRLETLEGFGGQRAIILISILYDRKEV